MGAGSTFGSPEKSREMLMRPYAIRLLMLTISATAMVVVPVVTATKGEASSRHLRKHHQRASRAFSPPRIAGDAVPVARPLSRPGSVCPGNARAIDCTVWPPPFEDDPDRKATSSDGG
jgi:hypothetical protein